MTREPLEYGASPFFFLGTRRIYLYAAFAVLLSFFACFVLGSRLSLVWGHSGRWDRYAAGGSFIGCNPEQSPDGLVVIYSSPRSGHGDIYRVNIDGSNTVQLTSDLSYEGDASFSPDGKRIVFIREVDGKGHIWLMDADGSNQSQLTSGESDDMSPAFSPDGSKLVFSRRVRGWPFIPGSAASAELFMIDLDGTGEKRLTFNEKPDWEPTWSRGGGGIAYGFADGEIWAMNSDGSNARFLISGDSPSFSADGMRVVFLSGGSGREISTIKLKTMSVQRVYASRAYLSHPTFSADGASIMFLEEPDARGIGEIYILDPTQGKKKRLATTK